MLALWRPCAVGEMYMLYLSRPMPTTWISKLNRLTMTFDYSIPDVCWNLPALCCHLSQCTLQVFNHFPHSTLIKPKHLILGGDWKPFRAASLPSAISSWMQNKSMLYTVMMMLAVVFLRKLPKWHNSAIMTHWSIVRREEVHIFVFYMGLTYQSCRVSKVLISCQWTREMFFYNWNIFKIFNVTIIYDLFVPLRTTSIGDLWFYTTWQDFYLQKNCICG